MKRTKQKDTQTCQWCKKLGIKRKADWKYYGSYACNEHKDQIKIDDDYMSEADHQTWSNL